MQEDGPSLGGVGAVEVLEREDVGGRENGQMFVLLSQVRYLLHSVLSELHFLLVV